MNANLAKLIIREMDWKHQSGDDVKNNVIFKEIDIERTKRDL